MSESFFEKISEGLPGSASAKTAPLLQGGSDVGGEGIGDDRQGSFGNGMGQPDNFDQEGLGGGEGGLHGRGPKESRSWTLETIREQGEDLGGVLDEPAVKVHHPQVDLVVALDELRKH